MKVLLNIAAERVQTLGEWFECEGVRLVEQADGSLNLEITADLATQRQLKKEMDELFSGADRS